ncbi:MAG TPA: gamma-glutamyltransferase [Bryobacteraceae bacterium]|jgi:gamma-glutamyltranspeptidase/glutathione hydrolase|nr:gamma-glutamyltransferase [Bryobacteraceae bacterium]
MRLRVILCAFLLAGTLLARQPVLAQHAMVVAQEPLAADVGLAVLRAGGNAVDAAVAVGFALAVTYPFAGNIGGGGFMLIRFADGTTTFIDFREKAPLSAARNMYLDADGKVTKDSVVGWRACGVPGSVRGFGLAHEKYGSKPWAELINPAIQLATGGFPLTYQFSQSLISGTTNYKLLSQFPESTRIFLTPHYGDNLAQPELAATLTRIRDNGPGDFYEGEIAHKLAAAMEANGGLITLDDLKQYQAVERTPLRGHYRDYEVITAPPPSAGGIGILQMLGMLEGSGYEKAGAGSAASIHYVAETMRRFYADRSEYFGDPDFFKVPVSKLLDPRYIARRRESIDPQRVTPSQQIRAGNLAPYESTETTHFNIVDKDGNTVAVTYTLNGGYGNGVTVPGLGFLLNNEMDDFAAKPGEENMFHLIQGEANAIQPAKRPLSSMTPTILTRDGKVFMVLGAPGGSRIISGVLQIILNVVDFHMNVQEAVDWPRFHHQWMPDHLYLEKGISPDTTAILRGMGHRIAPYDNTNPVVARVEAIVNSNGWLQGAADGRGNAKAEGY